MRKQTRSGQNIKDYPFLFRPKIRDKKEQNLLKRFKLSKAEKRNKRYAFYFKTLRQNFLIEDSNYGLLKLPSQFNDYAGLIRGGVHGYNSFFAWNEFTNANQLLSYAFVYFNELIIFLFYCVFKIHSIIYLGYYPLLKATPYRNVLLRQNFLQFSALHFETGAPQTIDFYRKFSFYFNTSYSEEYDDYPLSHNYTEHYLQHPAYLQNYYSYFTPYGRYKLDSAEYI